MYIALSEGQRAAPFELEAGASRSDRSSALRASKTTPTVPWMFNWRPYTTRVSRRGNASRMTCHAVVDCGTWGEVTERLVSRGDAQMVDAA